MHDFAYTLMFVRYYITTSLFHLPFNWLQNHIHDKSFSKSTTQKSKEKTWSLALSAKAVKRVPLYLFFRLIPSIKRIGQQCCQHEIESDNAIKK